MLEGWGEKYNDTAVIAEVDSSYAGATWFRCWDDENNMRVYMDETVPVVVIGVHEDFRRMDVGTALLTQLAEKAAVKGIRKLSLCVSKDNHVLRLYRSRGYIIYEDIGDPLIG